MHPATHIAYTYLSKYQKTIQQTQLYLKKKWYEDDEIETAIYELKDLDVLDDYRYADMYLAGEVISKWKPLIVVKQKLYHKWVSTVIIQNLINENSDEYTSAITSRLEKLWSQKKEQDTPQKWIQRMMSRGYAYELVLCVSQKYTKES
jgi:regulatory protein